MLEGFVSALHLAAFKVGNLIDKVFAEILSVKLNYYFNLSLLHLKANCTFKLLCYLLLD